MTLFKTIDYIEELVRIERASQDLKWGEQNWPDGTGMMLDQRNAELAKTVCERAVQAGMVSWRHILDEEVKEVFAEKREKNIKEELIQVMAVCKQWIEAIDRREEMERDEV